MELDDLEPRTKKPQPKNLEGMSIEELESYIAHMQSEIARAQATIAAKKNQRGAADALFRKR